MIVPTPIYKLGVNVGPGSPVGGLPGLARASACLSGVESHTRPLLPRSLMFTSNPVIAAEAGIVLHSDFLSVYSGDVCDGCLPPATNKRSENSRNKAGSRRIEGQLFEMLSK